MKGEKQPKKYGFVARAFLEPQIDEAEAYIAEGREYIEKRNGSYYSNSETAKLNSDAMLHREGLKEKWVAAKNYREEVALIYVPLYATFFCYGISVFLKYYGSALNRAGEIIIESMLK